MDAGSILHLARLIESPDARLKVKKNNNNNSNSNIKLINTSYILIITLFFFILQRQVFSALSQISKHSVELAEMVVEAEIFPVVLQSLKGTVHIIPEHEILHVHWDISSDDCVHMCIDCSPVMEKIA